MIDFLMIDAGIISVDKIDEKATAERLYPIAFEFLAHGGSLSWLEWKSLSPISRTVFAQAGIDLRGLASQPEKEEVYVPESTLDADAIGKIWAQKQLEEANNE